MIAVCGSGTALSAAQPAQTAIMEEYRVAASRQYRKLLNASSNHNKVNLVKPWHPAGLLAAARTIDASGPRP
jgi:hypothetical protein